jgi:hypothetical protein
MFDKKVSTLLSNSTKTAENAFIKAAEKASNETLSGNGALKYSTSGNDFVDNFAAISTFKEPRSYQDVSKDMSKLWSQDSTMCLKLSVFIRMITRAPKVVTNNDKEVLDVQRGQGLKNEGIMRMMWLAINHPRTFEENLHLFIAAGSWNDVFKMLNLDLQYHGWGGRKLDWKFLLNTIRAGLVNPETTNLVRKYLPTIRTNKKAKTLEAQADTLIGRWIAKKLFDLPTKAASLKAYRKLKSDGTAHEWQQLISKQLYDEINFDHIAGRALQLLVGSEFLENHNLLDKYIEWIESKPVAKFTGFVHELFKPIVNWVPYKEYDDPALYYTINAQFKQLIETGKKDIDTSTRLIVARDISGSMDSKAIGCNMTSENIAKAMALYFSQLLTGPFTNSFFAFNSSLEFRRWSGATPVDKFVNDQGYGYGSTDFMLVIDFFIKLKNKGVPESDFPTGILCISDGEFNNCGNDTNFNTAIKRLREAGFSDEYVDNFKLILWDIPNSYYGSNSQVKFEDFADAPNFFYLSGYDPSSVAFILNGKKDSAAPKNAKELFEAAMDQTLLNRLAVID